MVRADLQISMKNAMAKPLDRGDGRANDAEKVHPGVHLIHGDGRGPQKRSFQGLLFGRVADYARRYLTASVEHRLSLVQSQLDLVQSQLDASAAQSDRIELLAERLLAAIEGPQAQLILDMAGVKTDLKAVEADLRALPSMIGPRLDEIEVKIRPLIAFDEESYAVRLRDGYAMVPRSEAVFAVMVANATSAGLEPGTRRVLQALIQPGMSVADIGANVGLLTLACAVATGPTGRVYAFEPEAGPRSQLEKTRYINGLRWVEVFDLAVGAKTGKQTFHISPVIGHSSLYELPEEDGKGRNISIKVTKLDDVLAPGERLDVVKIDVEGAELDVLSGMGRILSDNPDLAIIAEYGPSHLSRIGLTPETWFGAFEKVGLEAHLISEPDGVCRRIEIADLRDVISVNIAFVRRGGKAVSRLPK